MATFGSRVSSGLADEVVNGQGAGTWGAALIGYALSVHLGVLAVSGLGVYLIVATFPNPITLLIGALFVGIGVLGRPRFASDHEPELDRSAHPELYELTERVAQAMDVRPPHAIDVSAEVNAWIGRYGWRQTRRLTIGLPLFALLDPQERVALLAHELAHERHGDLARMPLVQGAMSTLSEVYWLLVPYPSVWVTRSGRRYRRSLGIDALINPVMAFLALLMRPTVRLYVLLMARQTQRGEYLADAAAAEVAGSAAARSSFMKLHAAAAFSGQVLTTSFSEEDQIFDRLRRRVQSAPGHEWLRVERVMALEKSRLDVTHPPSARRVEVIGRMPMREPAVIATAEQMAQIDRELSAAESAVAREMADRHRGRLYS